MPRRGLGVEALARSIRISFTRDGRRERVTLDIEPTPTNLKFASRLAADIRRDVARGLEPSIPTFARTEASRAVTVGDMGAAWLKTKGRKEAATRAQYESAVRFWERQLGADTPVHQLRASQIEGLVGGFAWKSPAQTNNYLIALRGMLDLAVRDGAIPASPAAAVKNVRRARPAPDPLTDSEVDAVLERMSLKYDMRVAHYFSFAFATGMRPEEIIALRWEDVDWKANVVRVRRARTFKGGLKGTKTGVERDVELSRRAYVALFEMKRHTFLKGGYVFENPVTGEPWHDERAQRDTYWAPTLKALGIRGRRAYCTRHTFATKALMSGCNPAWIAKQLGNSVTMVTTVYARWIEGADRGGELAKLDLTDSCQSGSIAVSRKD